MTHDDPTAVPLRDHIEGRLEDAIVRIKDQIAAMERNTDRTVAAMNERLAELNQVRLTVADVMARSITRAEHELLIQELQRLREIQASRDGRVLGMSAGISLAITLLGLAGFAIAHLK